MHANYECNMLPCVFALLTGKVTNDYKSLLTDIKEAALSSLDKVCNG